MKPGEYIKKGLTFLMLLAYVFAILKPLTPLAKDLIAHTFDQTHHMATVHFENGKYHIHKEMAAEAAAETPKKSASENFSSEEFLAHHLFAGTYTFRVYHAQTGLIDTPADTKVSDIFFKTFNPPPEA